MTLLTAMIFALAESFVVLGESILRILSWKCLMALSGISTLGIILPLVPILQQFFTPYPDSHHDTLRLHGALVQGEVSFSRCISSYCTTGWRLPPLLSLSIIVTFIDMNNRSARPPMLTT